jgi:hypothetical protein
MKHKKNFTDMDEAYRVSMPFLIVYAKRHLINQNEHVDVCHDAFVKALKYFEKGGKRISMFLLYREVARACRRANKKHGVELPTDFNDVKVRDKYASKLQEKNTPKSNES